MAGQLEQYADRVAVRVAGEKPEDESTVFGIDWTVLAELIQQIILALAEDCPTNDSLIVRIIKSPNRFQRVRFKAAAYRHCNQCHTYRWRSESGAISEAMIDEMSQMSDADVLAVVFESRHDDWILV